MQYFNVNMIDDYLKLGLKFKVFVNGDYLVVTDPDDLVNSDQATGYNEKGQPVKFSYMDVDHVKIGSVILTKDELNKSIEDKKNKEEEPTSDEDDTASDTEEEPAPDEEE